MSSWVTLLDENFSTPMDSYYGSTGRPFTGNNGQLCHLRAPWWIPAADVPPGLNSGEYRGTRGGVGPINGALMARPDGWYEKRFVTGTYGTPENPVTIFHGDSYPVPKPVGWDDVYAYPPVEQLGSYSFLGGCSLELPRSGLVLGHGIRVTGKLYLPGGTVSAAQLSQGGSGGCYLLARDPTLGTSSGVWYRPQLSMGRLEGLLQDEWDEWLDWQEPWTAPAQFATNAEFTLEVYTDRGVIGTPDGVYTQYFSTPLSPTSLVWATFDAPASFDIFASASPPYGDVRYDVPPVGLRGGIDKIKFEFLPGSFWTSNTNTFEV